MKRQRGATLIFALTGLVALTIAAVAMMRTSDTSTLVAGNVGFHSAAVQVTDMVLESQMAMLAAFGKTTGSQSDNTSLNYYASLDATAPDPTLPPASRLSASTPNPIIDAGTGNTMRYVIERMCNATGVPTAANCLLQDSMSVVYRVTTLVTGPRNTSATVQHYLSAGGLSKLCGIMVQDGITSTNGITVTGTNNCLAANGDVSLNNTTIIGDVISTGTVDNVAKITAGGGTPMPGQPPTPLPTINPSLYKSYADYVFKSDGHVYQQSGGTLTDLGTSWYGWTYGGGDWSKGGSNVSPAGLYYFEGNVVCSASPGDPTTPWNVSWLVEGSVGISGSPFFKNYINPAAGFPAGVNYIFMMAAGDIKFTGSTASAMEVGLLAAGSAIQFTNHPVLKGQVIATNQPLPAGAKNWNNGANKISNNLDLEYNGGGASLWGTSGRWAWRSVFR